MASEVRDLVHVSKHTLHHESSAQNSRQTAVSAAWGYCNHIKYKTPLSLFVSICYFLLLYEPFHLLRQIYHIGLTCQTSDSLCIYAMSLSPFFHCFACIPCLMCMIIHPSEEECRMHTTCPSYFYRSESWPEECCWQLDDESSSCINYTHGCYLFTPRAAAPNRSIVMVVVGGMMPALLSFLLQNINSSAVFSFTAIFWTLWLH